MSRSNNTDIQNPAIRFYEWSGLTGELRYWDKSLGEKGQEVKAALPFTFMVLDSLATIKGYSDGDQGRYYSNEVRDVKNDILTVRTKKRGPVAKGVYANVISSRACAGAKYCQSVYVAIKEDDGFHIANLQFTGAAVSAWIDFRNRNKNIYDGAIKITGATDGKKGAVSYKIPTFVATAVSQEASNIAVELDKELQEYLTAYFKRNRDAIAQEHQTQVNYSSNGDDHYDDVPAEEYEDVATGEPANAGAPAADDLPF